MNKDKDVGEMFYYCGHCGWITGKKIFKNNDMICEVCSEELKEVPQEYLTASGLLFISQDKRKEFIETVIKTAPEFNPNLFEQHEHILNEKKSNLKEQIEMEISTNRENEKDEKICCPICGSKKLSRISNVKKVAKVYVFGIFGVGDLGRTWKCSHCGAKF
ncbi:MAG: hypothetical protein ABGU93_05430 [Acetobacterium sp.]|uniref:hypothetical protein n=1 Tax=Acetobacterium sp. TaxID=1872094 RepID=UPI0032420CCB